MSTRPTDAIGRWEATVYGLKAHKIKDAYYVGALTQGTMACGITLTIFEPVEEPKANRCKTCDRSRG